MTPFSAKPSHWLLHIKGFSTSFGVRTRIRDQASMKQQAFLDPIRRFRDQGRSAVSFSSHAEHKDVALEQII